MRTRYPLWISTIGESMNQERLLCFQPNLIPKYPLLGFGFQLANQLLGTIELILTKHIQPVKSLRSNEYRLSVQYGQNQMIPILYSSCYFGYSLASDNHSTFELCDYYYPHCHRDLLNQAVTPMD